MQRIYSAIMAAIPIILLGCRTVESGHAVKIMGGTAATADTPGFTNAVGIVYSETPTSTKTQGAITYVSPRCTGVLVSQNVVLTAGHCVNQDLDIIPRYIYFEHADNGDNGIRKVLKSLRHPLWQMFGSIQYDANRQFVSALPSNDLALLSFDGQAPSIYQELTAFAGEAQLKHNQQVVLAGYGLTSNAPQATTVLSLKSINAVVASYTNNSDITAMLTVNAATGQEICAGDSGGPAYLKSAGTNNWTLAAITLGFWNESAACSQTAEYTAVAPFADWITSNISAMQAASTRP